MVFPLKDTFVDSTFALNTALVDEGEHNGALGAVWQWQGQAPIGLLKGITAAL